MKMINNPSMDIMENMTSRKQFRNIYSFFLGWKKTIEFDWITQIEELGLSLIQEALPKLKYRCETAYLKLDGLSYQFRSNLLVNIDG